MGPAAGVTDGATSTGTLATGVRAGDRGALARAITLVESRRADHRAQAAALLTELMPATGGSFRVGITGVPGVGKSTFIDGFGTMLTEAGHRVAVLAVDPSSQRTGGSILADKTRMGRLSVDPRAFVRPSPAGATLGGVGSRSRETLLLCEAAGYDVVLVETVGVGQSETVVAEMTDVFLVLLMPGAGDQLQGIKRGVMELADILAVNKADGDMLPAARRAVTEARAALRYLHPRDAPWQPPVIACSATEGRGFEEIWSKIEAHRAVLEAGDGLAAKRAGQLQTWMWQLVDESLRASFRANPAVRRALPMVTRAVAEGTLAPTAAAAQLLDAFAGTETAEGAL